MTIANTIKTAALSIAVLFTTSAMAGTTSAAESKATTEASLSAENNGPKPKYRNSRGGLFSNTRKTTCHAGWSTKVNKNLTGNKRAKGVNFPGT